MEHKVHLAIMKHKVHLAMMEHKVRQEMMEHKVQQEMTVMMLRIYPQLIFLSDNRLQLTFTHESLIITTEGVTISTTTYAGDETTIAISSGNVISLTNPSSYIKNVDANIEVQGDATNRSGSITLNCENNSHGIKIKGPPHSAGATYTLTLPNNDGNADQVLKTDGHGNLSWVDQTSGGTTINSLVDITDVPQYLSGNKVLSYFSDSTSSEWVDQTTGGANDLTEIIVDQSGVSKLDYEKLKAPGGLAVFDTLREEFLFSSARLSEFTRQKDNQKSNTKSKHQVARRATDTTERQKGQLLSRSFSRSVSSCFFRAWAY